MLYKAADDFNTNIARGPIFRLQLLQFCHDNCYMLSDFVPDNSFTFHAKALDNVPRDTV